MLRIFTVLIMLTCTCLISNVAWSQQHVFVVDTAVTIVDANAAPYNQVKPGDTLLLNTGPRRLIRIKNFTGEKDKPVIITNNNGQVLINTDLYYGISILNCRYFRLTGSGDVNNFYGIKIGQVADGAGIGIGGSSSDYEIDHVSIENCRSAGIFAKTDPDCSLLTTRDKFTQNNTRIHDNYIGHVGTEGLYVGSTYYFGQTINCNGVDTLLMPSLLEGVKIYKNIIEYSGWDGIQVSSAVKDCQVNDNMVLFDSRKEDYGQMSGIIIGGGSKCDCYNNFISQGNGNGIEIYGLAGLKVFNNIIIDAGKNFLPEDPMRMVYGIFITDVTAQKDSSFNILFNTILNPKSDGIRFVSSITKNNLIASNAIINPGAYDYYENGNTNFSGKDSYIMLPDPGADVLIKNNYVARTAENAGFASDGYSLIQGSPLINAAWIDNKGITFDYSHKPRPYGVVADIGAVEYDPSVSGTSGELITKPAFYPNPVNTLINIKYKVENQSDVIASIYDMDGSLKFQKEQTAIAGESQSININVTNLPPGIYIYSLNTANQHTTGKFIKVD
jgi:hypothetical protein